MQTRDHKIQARTHPCPTHVKTHAKAIFMQKDPRLDTFMQTINPPYNSRLDTKLIMQGQLSCKTMQDVENKEGKLQKPSHHGALG